MLKATDCGRLERNTADNMYYVKSKTESCNLDNCQADNKLNLPALKKLLQRVQKSIHQSPDPVRYQMNSFVIAVGCYVEPLTEIAIQTAEKIGTITADMGDTSCEVPSARDRILNMQSRGTIGKKRKTAKC